MLYSGNPQVAPKKQQITHKENHKLQPIYPLFTPKLPKVDTNNPKVTQN